MWIWIGLSDDEAVIHSFTYSFIHSFIHSLTHSFIHSFIHPSIHSVIHSFIFLLFLSFFLLFLCRPQHVGRSSKKLHVTVRHVTMRPTRADAKPDKSFYRAFYSSLLVVHYHCLTPALAWLCSFPVTQKTTWHPVVYLKRASNEYAQKVLFLVTSDHPVRLWYDWCEHNHMLLKCSDAHFLNPFSHCEEGQGWYCRVWISGSFHFLLNV